MHTHLTHTSTYHVFDIMFLKSQGCTHNKEGFFYFLSKFSH